MNLIVKILSVIMWLACLCFLVSIGVIIGLYHNEMMLGDWIMMTVCALSTMWFSFIFIELVIEE